jgi:membrane fusion protein, multidrug efflux system
MKRSTLKNSIYMLIALALLLGVILKLKANKEQTEAKQYQFDKTKPVPVEASLVQLTSLQNGLKYTGIFEAQDETKLSTEIPGKINEVHVDLGDFVKQGAALIQLDKSMLTLQLEAIEIQLEGLEKDRKRNAFLVKEDVIQAISLEKTELALRTAKNQKLSLLEQIKKTTIRAPFDGVISFKFCSEGGFAGPGTPLLQLTALSTLNFAIQIPEEEINNFKIGEQYAILVPALNNQSIKGISISIGSKSSIGNTYPVYFQVQNSEAMNLKIGMTGEIFRSSDIHSKGIWIPSSSIVNTGVSKEVYLIKNNKAYKRKIETSTQIDDHFLIQSGIKAGDSIVTNGVINLFEGASVLIQ